jgi:pyruvate ferredoxin oxidoreductase delta subunit
MKQKKIKINPGAVVTEPGSSIKNKTAGWRSMRPEVDQKKCVKCGLCWSFCPDMAIKLGKKGIEIDYDFCKGCGICAMQCPNHSIIMKKEEK